MSGAVVVPLPTPASVIFRTLEALPEVDAAVQPAPDPYTHLIQAGSRDQAATLAAALLTEVEVPLLRVADRTILVRMGPPR